MRNVQSYLYRGEAAEEGNYLTYGDLEQGRKIRVISYDNSDWLEMAAWSNVLRSNLRVFNKRNMNDKLQSDGKWEQHPDWEKVREREGERELRIGGNDHLNINLKSTFKNSY